MTERYTHGHFGAVVDNHAARTAADSAAFLLPHLRSHQVLLDIGCGPGSITSDLAARVGKTIGIDAAAEAVARARRDARGAGNLELGQADVYHLPFAGESFDVVYAHQVLQHLGQPVRALREALRVLRPGGILAVRDSDYATMVHDPHQPLIDRWLELYSAVARHNGGEPNAGRMLFGWVHAAGFTEVTATTSTWTYATAEAVARWTRLWTSRLREARLGKDAIRLGFADRDEIERLAAGWEEWSRQPHPYFAFMHGEVLAMKPRD